MRFDLAIPDPSTMRVGKEAYVDLRTGTELHRIHPTAFLPEQFNDTARGNARFSPIRDTAGVIIPTIYGAESFECAACEIILRCPDVPPVAPTAGPARLQIVFPRDFSGHSHSVVRTTVDLHLVDLTGAGQRQVGIDRNALVTGPTSTYPRTRGWAEHVHTGCPGAHGLYYSSVQWSPHFAVVLFGDRLPAGALTPASTRPVADPACHDDVRVLAARLSIDYEDV
ncbi:hypothetical protein AFCDBAGC_0179 [Methylobacterium cerastii]|uniref:RES domain-containing protein n=2 Tax=Methylobacterium TaxID=407 RepID=A0ABQ4U5K8_9HYPH|nr:MULTISPECIES: RES family NAD+ phosphorylase [Methylobacterium]TXM79407.1 RES family NAD+ phosphorylase [Methylobacterium sp. WL69]TXN23639.1 RES family NAD+ phosphorylase [Methylobacterium sp. WL19]GJD42343.1 hypothetical protein AFCDBAGC_0179 [Methylobacterium cerastii]GJE62313.1 hypothetical protein MPOCJGCO_4446 [Methylobacterium trifolii]